MQTGEVGNLGVDVPKNLREARERARLKTFVAGVGGDGGNVGTSVDGGT